MVHVHVDVLFALSVTEHKVVVTPIGAVIGEVRLQTGLALRPELSVAVAAAKKTCTPGTPSVGVTARLMGQVITGFAESMTESVNEHVAVLPALSVAVQPTV
jgi:hypothetical protein